MSYLPVYNLNVPNGGLQMPSNAQVYSTYTGKFIGYGL